MGNKIWRSPITGGPGDELCYSVFLAGLKQNEIRKDVIKSPGVNQFEQAVKAAVETENILSSAQPKETKTSSDQVPLSILQVDQTEDNRSNNPNRSRPREDSHSSNQQEYRNFASRDNGNSRARVHFNLSNNRYHDNSNPAPRSPPQRQDVNQRSHNGAGAERRYRDKDCYRCGRRGHIARFCRTYLNSQRAGPSTGPYTPHRQ